MKIITLAVRVLVPAIVGGAVFGIVSAVAPAAPAHTGTVHPITAMGAELGCDMDSMAPRAGYNHMIVTWGYASLAPQLVSVDTPADVLKSRKASVWGWCR